MNGDARLYAPSAARNMEPICSVLGPLLPEKGLVLEIASGSGEHITRLAALAACGAWGATGAVPAELTFQPSDPGGAERRSIDAWAADLRLENVLPAIAIDAAADAWPVIAADVVFCINMIHISPWRATEGLFRSAARVLPARGVLFTYGPYKRGGVHTSAGNEAFDADLRARNAEWGIRDVADVAALAEATGFSGPDVIEMPANNLSLVFRRR